MGTRKCRSPRALCRVRQDERMTERVVPLPLQQLLPRARKCRSRTVGVADAVGRAR